MRMVQNAKTGHEKWLEGGRGPASGDRALQGLDKMPPSPARVQGRARDIYRETGKMLVAAGILARADLGLLERYATLKTYAESIVALLAEMPIDFGCEEQTAMRSYMLKASSELRQIEQALGLSPVARARMGKHQPPQKEDTLTELRSKREELVAAARSRKT